MPTPFGVWPFCLGVEFKWVFRIHFPSFCYTSIWDILWKTVGTDKHWLKSVESKSLATFSYTSSPIEAEASNIYSSLIVSQDTNYIYDDTKMCDKKHRQELFQRIKTKYNVNKQFTHIQALYMSRFFIVSKFSLKG